MNYNLYDIFTPSSPATLTFVDRRQITSRLERAMNTKGKQIILYGYSKSGKTTLIKNYLSNNKIDSIKIQCTSNMTFNDLILNTIDGLDVYIKDTVNLNQNGEINSELSASFLGLKASIGSKLNEGNFETFKRISNPIINIQLLAKLLGEKKLCWLIDDFHKIPKDEKVFLSQTMKVFMDCSDEYPNLKIVVIGAVNTARDIIELDKEMKDRVSEINVQLMDANKLKSIIDKGSELLNVKFENNVKEKIITLSCGLPSVTHSLCLFMCQEASIKKTVTGKKIEFNLADLKKSIKIYILENEDTYKSTYEKSVKEIRKRKLMSQKDLLFAMVKVKKEEFTILDILEILKINNKNYTGSNLKIHLDSFLSSERLEVLRYNSDLKYYYFSNPFFKSYIATIQQNEENHLSINKGKLHENMYNYLDNLSLAKMQFLQDFETFENEMNFEDDFVDDESIKEYKSILYNKLTK